MIMNEVDELLTQAQLPTRIVFIAYVDTMFAPERVTIRNPQRFSLLYAPITRSYCSSIQPDSVIPEPGEYLRNAWQIPKSAEENLAFLRDWQKTWKGDSFSYEYHFWKHQYHDLSGLYIARRIYEDIRSLKLMDLKGYVEDGSQRSFFPNGFAMYIYAQTLLDRNCDFDAAMRDYFSHAYGECWEQVLRCLEGVREAMDFAYLAGEKSAKPAWGNHYDPARVPALQGKGHRPDQYGDALPCPDRVHAASGAPCRIHPGCRGLYDQKGPGPGWGSNGGLRGLPDPLRRLRNRTGALL